MIFINSLAMRFGANILFENVSLQLNPGNRYGLVGANGSGKSTLIKLLSRELSPDKGQITIPEKETIGTLSQDHFQYENELVLNVVLMGRKKLWSSLVKKEKALKAEHVDGQYCNELSLIEETIELEGGYKAASEAAMLLEGLGILDPMHQKPLSALSGGYKLRVLLAQVLFSNPDILILDEPTNHLDLNSIYWLENYLQSFSGLLIVTSHDKSFLNACCNFILDIDYQTITLYKGNYDLFEKQKFEDKEQKTSLFLKQSKQQEHLQEFIDRFGAKATKARQAQSKIRQVEKLQEEMNQINLSKTQRRMPSIAFEPACRSGVKVLTAQGIKKSYGGKIVLENITFEVERQECVAILGSNGIGKSTLLEIITSGLKSDAGTFEWGHNTRTAYFPQDHLKHLDTSQTLLEYLAGIDPAISESYLRGLLGKVLFSGDDVYKKISCLSGGEAARLLLAKMILLKPNVLIFDEPTNHLDIEAVEALIQALKSFDGTILFVSHNRAFISALATRILEITPHDGLSDFKCSYQDYLQKRSIDLLSKEAKKRKKEKSDSQHFQQQKNVRNLKNQLEKKITLAERASADLERKISELNEILSKNDFYEKISLNDQQSVFEQKKQLEKDLESVILEWEDLHLQMTLFS